MQISLTHSLIKLNRVSKKFKNKTIVSLLLFCLAFYFLFLQLPSPVHAANWYDNNWLYRRPITVDNTGNASTLTQYQVKISLSSSNFDFSKPLSDGSDIGVTDSDGTTLIPYFIETYDSVGLTATVWVKLTSIPASSTYTIYMYYGNSAPQLFTIPPTGLFTRPTSAAAGGSAENMVFDDVTNKYYVVVGSTTDGPTVMYSSSSPSGPWTSEGTKINLGSAGAWDDHYSGGSPHLFKSGSTWYIYYYGAKTADGYNYFKIGYATSSSVTGPYTKAASNPVLDVGGVGAFDQYMAFEPYVFQATNGTWYLFYAGDEGGFGNRLEQVGYATASSPDGPWTKYSGNPVITFGTQPASDAKTAADPFVYGPIDGWYYIGYAGGATQASPWNNSMARTKDFVSFEKLGNIYARGVAGEWDSANAHRGAISRFGNTYYMPYLGLGTGTNWGVATMSALSTSKGYDPLQVLDYWDDFSGSTLDNNKWGVSSSFAGGSQTLSNGILTINSGTGTNRMLGGRREFGAGYMIEVRSRHNNADGTGNHAGEIGFGNPDNLSSNIRILDFNNPTNWLKGSNATLTAMSQTLDTNYHIHRVWFKSSTEVDYQNDSNQWETLTTTIPTISMQPFLFSFSTAGNSTSLNVDYIYVRKYTSPDPTNSVGSETSVPTSTSNSNSTPSAPSCGDTSPGSKAPWLYAAIAQDPNSVLLYFTEASDPVDKYVLEFGTQSNSYQYGSTNIGGKGTRTYLVKSLSPNTTYYFKVRGGNGCATGPWSNEVSSSTLGGFAAKTIPQPTPTSTTIPTSSPSPISERPNIQLPTINLLGFIQGVGNTFGRIVNSIASVWRSYSETAIDMNNKSVGMVRQGFSNIKLPDTNIIAQLNSRFRHGLGDLAFAVGERTQDVWSSLGLVIINIGYTFIKEPMVITNVKIAVLSSTSVKVSWNTNHPANSKVNYGETAAFGTDVQSEKRIKYHEFVITNLKQNTKYFLEVMSQNKNYVYDAHHEFVTPKE